MLHDIEYVLRKLDWMRAERIWPNGLRYLWTDAFGVVLLLSLYDELGDDPWLDEADCLVAEVERLLDEKALVAEITEMKSLIDTQYQGLVIDHDLGLGMMLWLAHFFPEEPWAQVQTRRSVAALNSLWREPGYFARASCTGRSHRVRQLWGRYRFAGGWNVAGTRGTAQRLFRDVPVGRRI
jgi:hypothetical protein